MNTSNCYVYQQVPESAAQVVQPQQPGPGRRQAGQGRQAAGSLLGSNAHQVGFKFHQNWQNSITHRARLKRWSPGCVNAAGKAGQKQ